MTKKIAIKGKIIIDRDAIAVTDEKAKSIGSLFVSFGRGVLPVTINMNLKIIT